MILWYSYFWKDEKLWFNLKLESLGGNKYAFIEHSHRQGKRDFTDLTQYMTDKMDEHIDWELYD